MQTYIIMQLTSQHSTVVELKVWEERDGAEFKSLGGKR